jgi:hypothetical protein
MTRIMNVAIHEAGHAVIAVHLHLPFLRVLLAPENNGTCPELEDSTKWAGMVEIQVPGRFEVGDFVTRRGAQMFDEPEVRLREKMVEHFEKQIMASCAGKLADDIYQWNGTVSEESSAGAAKDEEDIRKFQNWQWSDDIRIEVSDARVVQLRRRTERLVRIPYVACAIESIALDLVTSKSKSLSAREVRSVYRDERELWR